MSKFYIVIMYIFCTVNALNAQSISPSIINTNGGFTTLAGNHYEWSIGEMVLVNTASTGNLIVTQGILQPFKSSGGTATKDEKNIYNLVKVYPNPSNDILFMDADFKEEGILQVKLCDIQGKILYKNEYIITKYDISKTSYTLNMFAAGTYYLILDFSNKNNTYTATYKLEKTNP